MNNKVVLASLFVVFISACAKKQEVIFEAKSISYNHATPWLSDMKKECASRRKQLSGYLKDGWRVVTASPRTIPVTFNSSNADCVGTEYVIEK